MGNGRITSRHPPVVSKELQDLISLRITLSSDPDHLKLGSKLVALRQRDARLKEQIRVEENCNEPDWEVIASMKEKQKMLHKPMKLIQYQVATQWRHIDRVDRMIEAIEARD